MMVLLGEVGGVEEYAIAKAVKSGQITKPVVAWCIGTCATMFTTDVQFGHAGSFANSDTETARAKNAALKAVGVHVPETFEDLPALMKKIYKKLVDEGTLVPKKEPLVPKIPIDYSWAQELGLIRKPASFISTICDDRGQELFYSGMAISEIFKEDIGFGGALDGAAQMFSSAYDKGLSPAEFVSSMRKSHQLILGIGHKIKSRTNPDLRVSIVKDYVFAIFPNCEILKY